MTQYRLYAIFKGNTTNLPSRSNYVNITCLNPAYNVEVSPVADSTGTSITVTVTVTQQSGKNMKVTTDKEVILAMTDPNGTYTTYTLTTGSDGTATKTITISTSGTYLFSATTSATTNYKAGISTTESVNAGSVDTTLTLKANTTSFSYGSTATLTATLKDSSGALLSGKTIKLYLSSNSSYTSTTTNKEGIATFNITPSTVGSYTYYALYEGSTSTNSSTSSTITLTCNQMKTKINLVTQTLYNGWVFKAKLLDNNNTALTSKKVVVDIDGTSTTLTTDSQGTFSTTNNLPTSGSFEYSITYDGETNYTSSTLEGNMTIKSDLTVVKTPGAIANTKTKTTPYMPWTNLDVKHVSVSDDSLYAQCGVCGNNTTALGTASGSWNTPSPIETSNYGFNIPSGSTIRSITLTLRSRRVTCSSSTAYPTIASGTCQLTGLTSKTLSTPSTGYTTKTITWSSPGISSDQINKTTFTGTIKYGKNTSSNTGSIYLDYTCITVTYTPVQT